MKSWGVFAIAGGVAFIFINVPGVVGVFGPPV